VEARHRVRRRRGHRPLAHSLDCKPTGCPRAARTRCRRSRLCLPRFCLPSAVRGSPCADRGTRAVPL